MLKINMDLDGYIPLRDIVFKTLREAIITGMFKPGDRLMEVKLANELGVSRTPVREAIRKLEIEGMVIMQPRRGAIVAPINGKDLREILEIRKSLEGLSGQLAASRASDEQIAQLTKINETMEVAIKENDIAVITQNDVAFHDMINDLSGNDHLVTMLHQLKEHLFRYRLEFIKDMKNREQIYEEHKKIIEAISTKNSRGASREIEKHIEAQEKFILGSISKETAN